LENLVDTENFRPNALEHILEGELNGKGQAVGFHYDHLPTKKGEIIAGTETELDEHGVFEAEVSVEGVEKTSNRGRSTFFPDDWDSQDVVDAINEAFENKEFINGNTYEGLTEEGIIVRMYLDNNDKIISAFPVYEG
ncbi:MAG TPA: EndoU domain-containing protein, partial [Pseudogracilibacillus sp.]|nr:EndoU domain-containing protein [Pseudogracilibacillus sp.]